MTSRNLRPRLRFCVGCQEVRTHVSALGHTGLAIQLRVSWDLETERNLSGQMLPRRWSLLRVWLVTQQAGSGCSRMNPRVLVYLV